MIDIMFPDFSRCIADGCHLYLELMTHRHEEHQPRHHHFTSNVDDGSRNELDFGKKRKEIIKGLLTYKPDSSSLKYMVPCYVYRLSAGEIC